MKMWANGTLSPKLEPFFLPVQWGNFLRTSSACTGIPLFSLQQNKDSQKMGFLGQFRPERRKMHLSQDPTEFMEHMPF